MDNWEAETLNISGIVDDSIVDGPGLAVYYICAGMSAWMSGMPQSADTQF